MYTMLKMGSNNVSMVMQNMSDSPIYLKKGVQIAHIVSAMLVYPAELLLEMEATLGTEAQQELMSVSMHQEKFLEKLNLDGLSNWSPRNVVTTRELILAFHDIFTLNNNKLGCTSVIKQEICTNDSEPFKEQFRCMPSLLWKEVHALLHDMLNAGVICLSQSQWCNVVVLVCTKDGTLCFCIDFCHLNAGTKKDSYLLP